MSEKVEMIKIAKLKPWDRNPRTMDDSELAKLKKSIEQFGFVDPVLIDENNLIIGGHQRVRAAQALGWTEAPCLRIPPGWDEHKKAALNLALNKIHGDWDEEKLADILAELGELPDFDMDLTGFDAGEITDLTFEENEGLTDADAVPENAPAVCKPGQVWKLGEHRLMCGDATKSDDVGRLLAGAIPALMVTDPPYGVEYDANWRNEVDRANGKPYGASAIGKVTNDDRADWSPAWRLFPGDVIYSWHPPGATSLVHAAALQGSGFKIRMQIIWAKNQFPIGRGDYHVKHEPCWYCVREGRPAKFTKDRTQTTLWEIDKPQKSETGHSTQKPIECMARPIRNHDAHEIYDPFLGSGTTIIAAEQLGRKCYGLEIDPHYCDVIIKRWEDFTGKKAELVE